MHSGVVSLALFLTAISCVVGLLPTPLDCSAGLTELGIDELTATLTPCAFGAGDPCCNGINPLFKLGSGTATSACLCSELLLEEIINEVTKNALAAAAGFTGDQLKETLQSCGTNFFGGTGEAWCPSESQRINFSPDDIDDIKEEQAAHPRLLQPILGRHSFLLG